MALPVDQRPYLKLPQGGRIVSVAVTLGVGVNMDGRPEVPGMAIGASEAFAGKTVPRTVFCSRLPFWTAFLRGFTGVKRVIAMRTKASRRPLPASCPPPGSAAACISGATPWPTLARTGVGSCPPSSPPPLRNPTTRRPRPNGAGAQIRCAPRLPRLATLMDGAEEDVLACMTFPRQHRTKLHSTNPIARLNGEIKRRGIFPNGASICGLVGAIAMEHTKEWTVQRDGCMALETLAPHCDEVAVSLPAAQRA